MTRRRSQLDSWGPRHQEPRREGGRNVRRVVVLLGAWWLAAHAPTVLVGLPLLWLAVRFAAPQLVRSWAAWRQRRAGSGRDAHGRAGLDGVHLGVSRRGSERVSRADHAVLLLGPPRSGKTSSVVVPTLLGHQGAAVSTSTKSDVLDATVGRRSRLGRVWEFNPTGQPGSPAALALRWSPVSASGSWDGALTMARAMVAGSRVGAGATDSTHWAKRATALLAASLHAAATDGKDVASVLEWVTRHDLDTPGAVLERTDARSACGVLTGLQNTEAQERSSICSAAMDALDAYTSDAAIAAATEPNFDADAFVCSRDTIYIHAPAEDQALAAPMICGLLSDVRRATYAASRSGELAGRVLWALDEAANIAPLDELPAIASEGGGQGLRLLACFQDLSQARAQWGTAADGFLTLFGAKLVLPGVADSKTLESISVALGEYDRRMYSTSRQPNPNSLLAGTLRGSTTSTARQRTLPPGEIANIPAGYGLALDGLKWSLVKLTPAYRCEPWRSLSTLPADSMRGAGR